MIYSMVMDEPNYSSEDEITDYANELNRQFAEWAEAGKVFLKGLTKK